MNSIRTILPKLMRWKKLWNFTVPNWSVESEDFFNVDISNTHQNNYEIILFLSAKIHKK